MWLAWVQLEVDGPDLTLDALPLLLHGVQVFDLFVDMNALILGLFGGRNHPLESALQQYLVLGKWHEDRVPTLQGHIGIA